MIPSTSTSASFLQLALFGMKVRTGKRGGRAAGWAVALAGLLGGWPGPPAWGGGSGLNTLVVVNQNSANSVALGNYYCERRGVPAQNLLRINWEGGNTTWTRSEFENTLGVPLQNALTLRQLTNQIDYLVLCMDIPYQVTETTGDPATSGVNSTTSVLFYGFHPDGCATNCPGGLSSCNLPAETTNRYAGSEGIFRRTPPVDQPGNSWLAFLLTAPDLARAKAVVDLGVLGDAAFPGQPVFLTKSSDPVRNLRYLQADDVILNTQILGNRTVLLTNASSPLGLGAMAGMQIGKQVFTVGDLAAAPGAMIDNLTSYGGILFNYTEHTTAMDFIRHGATASYGTIVEPCAYAEKFPAAQSYFYQARGFSIAECYYQSLTNPYQGILVGEPLSAPFAVPGTGNWIGLPDGAELRGTTNLTLHLESARPLEQVDLFVDGTWFATVTNLPPQAGNHVSVTINGYSTDYVVAPMATMQTVVNGVVAQLNAITNVTKVRAVAHGDRIELQNLDRGVSGADVTLQVETSAQAQEPLTTFVSASRNTLLDPAAAGLLHLQVTGQVVEGDYLGLTVTLTNGAVTTLVVTNQTPPSGNPAADLQGLVGNLLAAVNAHPALTGGTGVQAEDLSVAQLGAAPQAQFNLRARQRGWPAAQIEAQLLGTFTLSPAAPRRLEDNVNDLRPRNHLYVTAGRTNWDLLLPLDTHRLSGGWHELTAVAYEGSHVRTQTRATQRIHVANTGWTATLTPLLGGSKTACEATLEFEVVASTNGITSMELFGSGGSLGISQAANPAVFTVPANFLGAGRHPIYAVVTRAGGEQYRTDTFWTRIVGPEEAFELTVTDPLPTLTWEAAAGRNYQILATTNLAEPFALVATVTPTNSLGRWFDPGPLNRQRFYLVSAP